MTTIKGSPIHPLCQDLTLSNQVCYISSMNTLIDQITQQIESAPNLLVKNRLTRALKEVEQSQQYYIDLSGIDYEFWATIPRAPQYEVSTYGRVRHSKTKRVRRLRLHRGKTPTLTIRLNGKTVSLYVHQLVAETFIGDHESKKHRIHHKDRDSTNNHLSNLKILTTSEHYKEHRGDGHYIKPGLKLIPFN